MNFFVPQPFLYFLLLFPFDYKNDKIQLCVFGFGD